MGQLKSSLAKLQGSLTNLSNLSKLYTKQYTSSDPSAFTATVGSTAENGTYQIKISSLAQAASIYTKPSAITDANNIGSGTITINIGSSSTISIYQVQWQSCGC